MKSDLKVELKDKNNKTIEFYNVSDSDLADIVATCKNLGYMEIKILLPAA